LGADLGVSVDVETQKEVDDKEVEEIKENKVEEVAMTEVKEDVNDELLKVEEVHEQKGQVQEQKVEGVQEQKVEEVQEQKVEEAQEQANEVNDEKAETERSQETSESKEKDGQEVEQTPEAKEKVEAVTSSFSKLTTSDSDDDDELVAQMAKSFDKMMQSIQIRAHQDEQSLTLVLDTTKAPEVHLDGTKVTIASLGMTFLFPHALESSRVSPGPQNLVIVLFKEANGLWDSYTLNGEKILLPRMSNVTDVPVEEKVKTSNSVWKFECSIRQELKSCGDDSYNGITGEYRTACRDCEVCAACGFKEGSV
jgi:hypothetical protein